MSSEITREEARYLILLALADSDLHGLGIARAVTFFPQCRTRSSGTGAGVDASAFLQKGHRS